MKKTVLYIFSGIIFLSCLAVSSWYFLDWTQIGTAAINYAYSQASSRGMRLSYTDMAGVEGGFAVNNLSMSGMVNIRFGTIIIRPKILTSIISLSGVCDIEFRDAQLQLGRTMKLGNGSCMLTLSPPEIIMENIRTAGELSVEGSVSFNPQAMRITRASARVVVPEELSPALEAMRNFLPLVHEGGNWYLRRND